ncbi:MAG: 2,3-bisphosphoglycerate-independent phosphoglycerate mutase [Gemmatimonadaceae bacterium]
MRRESTTRAQRPVALIVLDGVGHREATDGNAVALARMPTWKRVLAAYPNALIQTSGRSVGLPDGQMGNSEVGHLNLGAGRVVKQDMVRISDAIEDGSFFENETLLALFAQARQRGSTLHLMGLIGDGGVHALDEHLFALIDLAERAGVQRVAIHALLDGRDTAPTSGLAFMTETVRRAAGRARIASLGGRYFGMDRDNRWSRVKKWYDAVVRGAGLVAADPVQAIRDAYAREETDEFITPVVLQHDGGPVAPLRDGDAVFCFNFRSDRMRQIVRSLMQDDFAEFAVTGRPRLTLAAMTQYDATFPYPVAFPPFSLLCGVSEVIARSGGRQFHTAETEKYPHVTFFFNGGIEAPCEGEERLLVPSPKVATYDLQPEMSAVEVTDGLCRAIESGTYDFILCNYANGDMVGHTGVLDAAIKAMECVDSCLTRVLASAEQSRTAVILTADHGNCEMMIDPATGGPHTAHTTNPVPFVIVDPLGDRPIRAGGALCDVGPTALAMLGLNLPHQMTGRDLRLS